MIIDQSKSSGMKAAGSAKAAEVISALLINRSHRSVINLSIARSGRKELEKNVKRNTGRFYRQSAGNRYKG